MKLKKIFLSFVLMMSMLCAVACKDKGEDPAPETPPKTKSESVVHPSVADRLYLDGEKLEDIELLLAMGDTAGTVVWDDEDYVLVQGENECAWTFTPTDTESFKTKTGKLNIDAVKLETPKVENVVVASGQTIYIDQVYALITLQGTATFGEETVEGTFGWKEPTKTFVEGANVCTWVFKPTDKTKYKEVEGTITVEATAEQVPMSIAVYANSKTQYVAFDTIDLSAITLNLVYNGGKSEVLEFEADDVSITYNTGNSLRQGDTSVNISHDMLGFTTKINLDPVDYRTVQVPQLNQTHVYSAQPQVLTLAENSDSDKYTFESRTETDAGDYGIVVTLNNPQDDKWSNGDFGTTTVICTIQKAELEEVKVNYSGEFNGEAQTASVTNQTKNLIYYSEVELDESNFDDDGSTTPITKTNAGTYTVYYYMTGDKNHRAEAGTLTISISKQTPTLNLDYCYTLKTGNVVNYPASYAKVVDKQGRQVEAGDLTFTYYSAYTDDDYDENDILTSEADGAVSNGTAPKNDRRNEYFVVVGFAGNENYNAVSNHTVLFIDGADLALYAKSGEDAFAFKFDATGNYGVTPPTDGAAMITGSYSECNAYLEFEALELDSNGLKVVKFISKFGSGEVNKKNGRLVFASGKYLLLRDDGVAYTYTYNGTTEEISVQLTEQPSSIVTLKKWNIPKYLNTFTGKTLSDEIYNGEGYDKSKNTSQNTEIEFINDYGTIRFVAKVNVEYFEPSIGSGSGGYVEWFGVAEINADVDMNRGGVIYRLVCCVTYSQTGYYENVGSGFSIVWGYGDGAGTLDPSSVTLVGDGQSTSLLSGSFADLKEVTFTKVTQ